MPYEKAVYNGEQFIQACFGECVEYARRYVKDNPKEKYDYDDFVAVYRMKEAEEGWHVPIYPEEHVIPLDHFPNTDMERIVDIYERYRDEE